MIGGASWTVAFPVLCLVYFYSHYLFASQTAHVSSMYAAFLAVSVAVGTPPLLAALVLGFAAIFSVALLTTEAGRHQCYLAPDTSSSVPGGS